MFKKITLSLCLLLLSVSIAQANSWWWQTPTAQPKPSAPPYDSFDHSQPQPPGGLHANGPQNESPEVLLLRKLLAQSTAENKALKRGGLLEKEQNQNNLKTLLDYWDDLQASLIGRLTREESNRLNAAILFNQELFNTSRAKYLQAKNEQ